MRRGDFYTILRLVPKYDPVSKDIVPETEFSHFDTVLKEYVEKYKIIQDEFIEDYNEKKISEPKSDEYFLHDRAVRESGHDTTYRLEEKAGHLATVDLNSLSYKYEVDIAAIIGKFFDGKSVNPVSREAETPAKWAKKAELGRARITYYLWYIHSSGVLMCLFRPRFSIGP